jgi:hypothetical protein
MFFTREDSPIHHVGVTTVERPNQSSLHPSIKHRETEMFGRDLRPSRLGANLAGNLPKNYLDSLLLPIRNLRMIFNY